MTLATRVAQYLKDHGMPVINVEEPSDLEDGMVEVTPTLHVQIPLEGSHLNIVQEIGDDETVFRFGRSRETFSDILHDLRIALDKEAPHAG